MRFLRANGGAVELSPIAHRVLVAHRQLQAGDKEAGGVLLGRLIRDTSDVVVDVVSSPSPEDRRNRFSFFRARKPAQHAVDRAWRESGQVVIYLGEWHTHPEDDPSPSCIDQRDWKRIVAKASFEQDFLLFMIVGRVAFQAWELSRAKPEPVALIVEQESAAIIGSVT